MRSRIVTLKEHGDIKERCELYKQRENMKQISDYMDGLELHTKLRQKKVYQFYKTLNRK